jgi:hypothetical protein
MVASFHLFSYEFCTTSSLGRILSHFLFVDMCVGVLDDNVKIKARGARRTQYGGALFIGLSYLMGG